MTVRQLLDDGFQEDGNKAIRLYSKAIFKNNNNVEAFWRRGNEYYKMKYYDKAISDLTRQYRLIHLLITDIYSVTGEILKKQ